jgi:hypothetical protein
MHEVLKNVDVSLPEKNFDLDTFLLQRAQNPNFILIEIGHGGKPTAEHQIFTGKRAFIGVESWQRRHPAFDKLWSKKLSDLRKREGENIIFIDHDTGFKSVNNYENAAFGINNGRYEEGMVETILPNSAADEVFLSNVFGDRQVASGDNTTLLLKEIFRLVDNEGKVVIRESLTPERSLISIMNEEDLQRLGFKTEAKYCGDTDPVEWNKLESVFKSGQSSLGISTDCYYLILSKLDN